MLYFAKRAIIALAIMLSMSISASAHDFEVDGIYYYITSKSYKTCKVTYEGNIYDEYNNEYYGDIVIPESVTYNGITYSVTCIDEFAFAYCKSLKSVTIPESVTSISSYVFSGCTGLESIIVESGNTIYDSRDNCNAIIATSTNTLITGCKNTTIPNSVTSIGKWAFFGCSGLKSITIPNSVTSIGDDAFFNCTGLTSVTIPNSVTSIGNSAFRGCCGLTNVTIPNSVTSIGDYAFDYCSSLTSITIPNSVTSIGRSAFSGCNGLTSITIPNSVTSIGYYAFYNCTGLTSVNISDLEAWCKIDFGTSDSNPLYYAKNLYLNGELLTNIEIPNSITEIKRYAFNGCSGLTSVTIPESVTRIGNCAFYGCSGLSSVTSLSTTPPTCGTNVFYNVSVGNITLEVPSESISLYQSADTWKDFGTITAVSSASRSESSGIEDVFADGDEVEYYTLQGVKVVNPSKGLYIRKQGNKVTKVVL